MKLINYLFTCVAILCGGNIFAQVVIPDLAKVNDQKVWSIDNRSAKYDGSTKDVYMDAKPSNGVLWLKDIKFSNGTIEADLKGKNVRGQSFVGIAFHGLDEKTYDAVYFRPFNFMDAERRNHSVQYIASPNYDWEKLRNDSPGKYEHELTTVPDPVDQWFHAVITVQYPTVTVYVNGDRTASLQITQLSDRKTGYVGFWVGNSSDGNFKNLKITPAK